jgi:hypothetical protein
VDIRPAVIAFSPSVVIAPSIMALGACKRRKWARQVGHYNCETQTEFDSGFAVPGSATVSTLSRTCLVIACHANWQLPVHRMPYRRGSRRPMIMPSDAATMADAIGCAST